MSKIIFYKNWLKVENGVIKKDAITAVHTYNEYDIDITFSGGSARISYFDDEDFNIDFNRLIEWWGCEVGKNNSCYDCDKLRRYYYPVLFRDERERSITKGEYMVQCPYGKRSTQWHHDISDACDEWNSYPVPCQISKEVAVICPLI